MAPLTLFPMRTVLFVVLTGSAEVCKQGQGIGLVQSNWCSELGHQESMGMVSPKEEVGTVGDFKEAFRVYRFGGVCRPKAEESNEQLNLSKNTVFVLFWFCFFVFWLREKQMLKSDGKQQSTLQEMNGRCNERGSRFL